MKKPVKVIIGKNRGDGRVDPSKFELLKGNEKTVTVVIPALNEANNVEKVIRISKECEYVSEVIVVDNCSVDNTSKIAKKAGARVVKCFEQGKGKAMEYGFEKVKTSIVVFLDGDIPNYDKEVIEKLIFPIINDDIDFVKSTFSRQAGRVTEILVKPMMKILNPCILQYSQPLSGMIAGKKEFFNQITFENNYGVDISILIDMINLKAKIKEVNIGRIENDMKTLTELALMADEIAETIVRKSNLITSLELLEESENI